MFRAASRGRSKAGGQQFNSKLRVAGGRVEGLGGERPTKLSMTCFGCLANMRGPKWQQGTERMDTSKPPSASWRLYMTCILGPMMQQHNNIEKVSQLKQGRRFKIISKNASARRYKTLQRKLQPKEQLSAHRHSSKPCQTTSYRIRTILVPLRQPLIHPKTLNSLKPKHG